VPAIVEREQLFNRSIRLYRKLKASVPEFWIGNNVDSRIAVKKLSSQANDLIVDVERSRAVQQFVGEVGEDKRHAYAFFGFGIGQARRYRESFHEPPTRPVYLTDHPTAPSSSGQKGLGHPGKAGRLAIFFARAASRPVRQDEAKKRLSWNICPHKDFRQSFYNANFFPTRTSEVRSA
jgi:hypothetical protein